MPPGTRTTQPPLITAEEEAGFLERLGAIISAAAVPGVSAGFEAGSQIRGNEPGAAVEAVAAGNEAIATGGASVVGGVVDSVLAGIGRILGNALLALLGVGLAGAGLFIIFKPAAKRAAKTAAGAAVGGPAGAAAGAVT